jgi:serine/threonine protein phosphatase 1
MSARTIGIGDIHGCSRALESLVTVIKPQRDDVIVTLGDYIDRGPDSRGVIEQLIQLEQQCTLIPILGNHDEMLLRFLAESQNGGSPSIAGWLKIGGDTTLASYGAKFDTITGADLVRVPSSHLAFFERCRNYFETPSHIFVHAQYDAKIAMAEQSPVDLRWVSLKETIPLPHVSGKRVIVGHSSQKTGEILNLDYLVCIDTHCYAGGWLTAFDVNNNEVWQANREGLLRWSRSNERTAHGGCVEK